MMERVLADPELMALFDDPEVMAAVAEVAADSVAFAKHAHNPAVRRFYAAMGGLVGERVAEQAGSRKSAAVRTREAPTVLHELP